MDLRLAQDSDPPASVFGISNDKTLEWVLNPENGRTHRRHVSDYDMQG